MSPLHANGTWRTKVTLGNAPPGGANVHEAWSTTSATPTALLTCCSVRGQRLVVAAPPAEVDPPWAEHSSPTYSPRLFVALTARWSVGAMFPDAAPMMTRSAFTMSAGGFALAMR